MIVKFLVLYSKYYDGTEAGYEKALSEAKEITESNCPDVETAIKKWRKKYPAHRYDFDDVRWG